MHQLTRRQTRVLEIVREHIRTTGQSPTVREIAETLGVSSPCTVHRHLDALVKKRQLTRARKYAYRSYVPVDTHVPTIAELQERLAQAQGEIQRLRQTLAAGEGVRR